MPSRRTSAKQTTTWESESVGLVVSANAENNANNDGLSLPFLFLASNYCISGKTTTFPVLARLNMIMLGTYSVVGNLFLLGMLQIDWVYFEGIDDPRTFFKPAIIAYTILFEVYHSISWVGISNAIITANGTQPTHHMAEQSKLTLSHLCGLKLNECAICNNGKSTLKI